MATADELYANFRAECFPHFEVIGRVPNAAAPEQLEHALECVRAWALGLGLDEDGADRFRDDFLVGLQNSLDALLARPN